EHPSGAQPDTASHLLGRLDPLPLAVLVTVDADLHVLVRRGHGAIGPTGAEPIDMQVGYLVGAEVDAVTHGARATDGVRAVVVGGIRPRVGLVVELLQAIEVQLAVPTAVLPVPGTALGLVHLGLDEARSYRCVPVVQEAVRACL